MLRLPRRPSRTLDVVVATSLLVLLLPVLGLVALGVRVVDGSPVFFRQVRVGYSGDRFHIWKFRTMRVSNGGPTITVEGDHRISRLGRYLRDSKLDELPQLFNVIAGDMTLVGPRPEVPDIVQLYTEQQAAVLSLKPGITDPASIRYIGESELLATAADPMAYYISHVMPKKIAINLEYARRATLATDLKLIARTAAEVARLLTSVVVRRTTSLVVRRSRTAD